MPWWRRLSGHRSVAEQLIFRSEGVTVIVVDAEAGSKDAVELPPESTPRAAGAAGANGSTLGGMLDADRVVVWNDPVSKEDIFQSLARAVTGGELHLAESIVAKLREREKTGSTFLNEGVALPHARVEGLSGPRVALGLTHEGVLDAPTDRPVEVVFMLLSPEKGPSVHLQMLAKAGRMMQSRELRRRLAKARTPEAALAEIRDWEESQPAGPATKKVTAP